MVAARTGGNDVIPGVETPQMAWNNVIDRQIHSVFAAILAGKIVAPKDFTLVKLDLQVRAVNHRLQPDDRRDGVGVINGLNIPASV